MKLGMLWFDNDPKKTFESRAMPAIQYYKNKYGHDVTAIWVHPDTAISPLQGIDIVKSRSVMPNHFWVGGKE